MAKCVKLSLFRRNPVVGALEFQLSVLVLDAKQNFIQHKFTRFGNQAACKIRVAPNYWSIDQFISAVPQRFMKWKSISFFKKEGGIQNWIWKCEQAPGIAQCQPDFSVWSITSLTKFQSRQWNFHWIRHRIAGNDNRSIQAVFAFKWTAKSKRTCLSTSNLAKKQKNQ